MFLKAFVALSLLVYLPVLLLALVALVGPLAAKPPRFKDHWLFRKVCGVHIAVGRWFGNCFSPAIVLEFHRHFITFPAINAMRRLAQAEMTDGSVLLSDNARVALHRTIAKPRILGRFTPNFPAFFHLTLRFRLRETHIYISLVSIWWNSEHLARWFGQRHEGEYGPTVWQWVPPMPLRWLGHHVYL